MTRTSRGVTLRRSWAADLSTMDLYALLRLRVDVFVVEQECPYPELDGLDLHPDTRHFWLTGPDGVVACLRLLESALDVGRSEYRIGRVCTAGTARGRGYSRRLMEAALAEIDGAPCVLDAQAHAAGLYAAFGFEPVGAEFLEDGIPHITMRRPAVR